MKLAMLETRAESLEFERQALDLNGPLTPATRDGLARRLFARDLIARTG